MNATATTGFYLEHANISVTNLADSMRFFQTAFPDFTVRGSGLYKGRKWIHLGTADTYLALNEVAKEEPPRAAYGSGGVNHIGFAVSNVSGLAKRLLEAGYKRSFPRNVHRFRIREYFEDGDGNEFEFVEYLSEKPEERNSYED